MTDKLFSDFVIPSTFIIIWLSSVKKSLPFSLTYLFIHSFIYISVDFGILTLFNRLSCYYLFWCSNCPMFEDVVDFNFQVFGLDNWLSLLLTEIRNQGGGEKCFPLLLYFASFDYLWTLIHMCLSPLWIIYSYPVSISLCVVRILYCLRLSVFLWHEHYKLLIERTQWTRSFTNNLI